MRAPLESLRGWRQRAACLAIAWRNLPNMQLFAQLHALQRPARQLEVWLEMHWEHLVQASQPPPELPLSAWHAVLADDDSFGAEAAASGLRSLSGLQSREQEGNPAAMAGRESFALVCRFIEQQEGLALPDDDAWVAYFDRHPQCLQELAWQKQLARLLREQSGAPGIEGVQRLRSLAEAEGCSNIGIARDAAQAAEST